MQSICSHAISLGQPLMQPILSALGDPADGKKARQATEASPTAAVAPLPLQQNAIVAGLKGRHCLDCAAGDQVAVASLLPLLPLLASGAGACSGVGSGASGWGRGTLTSSSATRATTTVMSSILPPCSERRRMPLRMPQETQPGEKVVPAV